MRTVRTKVYKFAELSEKAKRSAIEQFEDINTTHSWYEGIFSDFKEKAKKEGFEVNEIYFSGFHSQGDGAMFEGKLICVTPFLMNVNKRVIRLIEKELITISCNITRSGRYCHERSASFGFDWYNEDVYALKNSQKEIDKIESNIHEAYIRLCRNLYSNLESAYEDLISEKEIIATIESNEYEFYSNGEFYKG